MIILAEGGEEADGGFAQGLLGEGGEGGLDREAKIGVGGGHEAGKPS